MVLSALVMMACLVFTRYSTIIGDCDVGSDVIGDGVVDDGDDVIVIFGCIGMCVFGDCVVSIAIIVDLVGECFADTVVM